MFELRVLSGLHQGAALPLFGEQWSIGSQADADLLLSDPGIAEHHAQLRLDGANWSVQAEAGLLHGAEGQALAQIPSLPMGVVFSIGSVRLCVALADQPWLQVPAPEPASVAPVHEPLPTLVLSSISHSQQKRLISVVLVVAVVIVLIGMVSSGEPEAQASLRPPEVRKHELASPYEVRQQLLKMLTERELTQRVSVQVVNNQVALSGDVSPDEVELVARMLSRFGERFDSEVPVISRVRARDSALPFKIVQIVGGPNGHVVLEEGSRLFLGDEVDGLRLVLIDNSKVVFDGERRYEVRW
ncbi:type III secretion protein [Pseudomonas fluorescens]|uniref:Type III secretion protein n=1 Tax=Pseudomonas lactucae TaxID=2813360 RepID=A0A9X1C4M1_9PSED|nr:FHA domain-containing protein [Pseudomonas lactucae]OPA97779.1 type III secretion protein [Pseudomonas fluorescens]MBN2974782.1 type III secretion protein [Pseudomonas lactucae]MBN2988020.1 type III secretion protein [Pseudomonas lactucae]OPB14044.1 type III secretion protein [Pseudomonas fluorescens]OPB27674.1 type III secretion protein [Pseudomonas fluorescens]